MGLYTDKCNAQWKMLWLMNGAYMQSELGQTRLCLH